MRAFIALVEVRGGSTETLAALKKFSDKHVSGLVEPRNRAVHDPRMLDRDTGQVHRLDVTARPKVHFGFKAESLDDQRKLHDRINDVITRFQRLRDVALAETDAIHVREFTQIGPVRPVGLRPDGQKSASEAQGSAPVGEEPQNGSE